jgi:hypothetical protein
MLASQRPNVGLMGPREIWIVSTAAAGIAGRRAGPVILRSGQNALRIVGRARIRRSREWPLFVENASRDHEIGRASRDTSTDCSGGRPQPVKGERGGHRGAITPNVHSRLAQKV